MNILISKLAEVWWFCRKLWEERRGWLTFAAVVCFLLVTVALWNARSPQGRSSYFVSSIVLSLLISLLAAALIEILALVRKLIDVRAAQKLFHNLFGFSDSGASVAVVVPKFNAAANEEWTEKLKEWEQGASDSPIKGPYSSIDACVKPDLVAASNIIVAFNEANFQVPTIIWDDEARREIADAHSTYTTFIVVGLYSNGLATWLNQKYNVERLFKMETFWPDGEEKTDTNVNFRLRLATYEEKRLNRKEETWDNFDYMEGRAFDYALIAKVKLPDNKVIFVFGGMDAPATEQTGKFLREHWQDILE